MKRRYFSLPSPSLTFSRIPWFTIGMICIFLFSLLLRFWKLSQFNTLVFDEVYYAKYGNYYLIGKPFFQSHPPLSQYLIAFSIWLGSFFPATPETTNELTGSLRSTFSYRWLNALIGSFFPLILSAIAYQLKFRRSYAFLAGLFAAADGFFLVESRYALNNIYLLTFGLLGQLFFLLAINQKNKSNKYLLFSGIFFGCCAGIKWNGLGFLLGIYLLLLISWIAKIIKIFQQKLKPNTETDTAIYQEQDRHREISLFEKCAALNLPALLLFLLVVPIIIYSVLWIPHLIINPEYNFWEVHQEIYSFHKRIGGNTKEVHPYCSPWYSWLVLWRPLAYYFNKNNGIIYDVHAMGNPVLWIFSSLAMLTVLGYFIIPSIFKNIINVYEEYEKQIVLFFLINYIANLLPWIEISRCTFLYHYLASYVFAILALAWLVDDELNWKSKRQNITVLVTVFLILVGFFYWMPVYLGLPLSDVGFKMRIIFPNWI